MVHTATASPWIHGRPGLAEQARIWQTTLPAVRRRAHADAVALATPARVDRHHRLARLHQLAHRRRRGPRRAARPALRRRHGVGLPVAPPDAGRGALRRAERLVQAGRPAYIKLGQFIASGQGLLPDEWVEAFAWCRDEAPPLRPGVAARVVAAEFGPNSELAAIDPEPLAAGSIGQAHRGVLRDGTEVVVKVRRPRLRRRLRADIETLALAGRARRAPAPGGPLGEPQRLRGAVRPAHARGAGLPPGGAEPRRLRAGLRAGRPGLRPRAAADPRPRHRARARHGAPGRRLLRARARGVRRRARRRAARRARDPWRPREHARPRPVPRRPARRQRARRRRRELRARRLRDLRSARRRPARRPRRLPRGVRGGRRRRADRGDGALRRDPRRTPT